MRHRVLGLITIGLGILLLYVAVPRTAAQLLLLPGNAAYRHLTRGEGITLEGYDRILRSRDAALGWVELPEARIQLGETLYLMARRAAEFGVDEGAALREARRQLQLGLAQAPANARAWLWLADASQALDDPEAAARAVRLSLLAAPRDVNVAPARAGLAFALWDRLADDARAIAAGDARRALWYGEGAGLVAQAEEAGRLELLRELVAGDPVSMERLAKLLQQQSAG